MAGEKKKELQKGASAGELERGRLQCACSFTALITVAALTRRLTMLFLLVSASMASAAPWDPSILAYRALLVAYNSDGPSAPSKNVSAADVIHWAATTRAARLFMAKTDPDYPLYHLAAPEGWNNDPNGVTFDPKDGGLYHRFYQVQRSCCCSC